MNKKFSTLMAAALLAGSFSVVAQNAHNDNGEITYRSQFVKSASLDQGLFGVNKIESDKWYQLVVNANSDMKANKQTMVLTQERDYATGRLYLAVKPIQDATLTHSLWKIVPNPQDVGGKTWQFINKETGMPLTFNHTDALTLTEDAWANLKDNAYTTAATNNEPVRYLKNVSDLNLDDRAYQQTGVMGLNPSVNRGCISNWAWMENRENSSIYYDSKLLYSYYHAGTDSIMALAMVKMNKATLGVPTSMNLEDENQYYVKTVKASESDFNEVDLNDDQKGYALVHIMPVVAGAKVLDADEINSMIDADESFLNFTNASTTRVPGYTRENDYVRAGDANYDKETVKFTILDLEGNAATVYNNPFDTTWYAVESDYKMLKRDNFSGKDDDPSFAHTLTSHYPGHAGNRTPYAGYNILFKNEVSGKFLKVLNELHESGNQGNYNALKVNGAEYAYSGEHRTMNGDEARFHWKVTYYATNDSLVLEPLNASRHDYEGNPDGIDASTDARKFFNTVNKGISFANPGAQQAFNKEKGVPVALYLMNIGTPADAKTLLTVGTPSGLNTFEANKYPAAPKFDATGISYDGFTGKVAGDNPAYVTNAKSYDLLYTPGNTGDANANAKDANNQDIINSGSSVVAANGSSEDYNLLYPKPGADYQKKKGTQWMRLKFAHDYSRLTRSTKEDALYFIQLKTDKGYTGNGSRVNGAYLVMNHQGRLMYASANENQEFGIMPSAQCVI